MTQTLNRNRHLTPQERVDAWLADFEAALAVRDIDRAVAEVRHRQLLARPRRVHLEHQDHRGPRPDCRHARRAAGRAPTRRASGPARRPPQDGDVTSAFIEFETAVRTRRRASAPEGRSGLDAADRTAGAQGPRGAQRVRPGCWAPCTAPTPTRGRGPRSAPKRTRRWVHDVQPYVAGHRRRSGRHRARRPAAPTRRARDRRRQARAARRPVAQALQVAVPARPGLVRPPALPAVPAELAGVRAEGQDRRLARVLHPRDGGAVLVEDRPACRRRSTPQRAAGPSRWTATANA